MIHRQQVKVYAPFAEKEGGKVASTGSVVLPAVFSTGIRTDVINFVHTNMSKNRRQGHAVKYNAGMRHSAESWGTGRAVARIPRVSGSGTQRSGQAAFGNMCRKGRMFAPIRIWRRWHRRTNLRQKRYAAASAIAASAILPLVQARGHRVDSIPELPLVINDKVEAIERTKEALRFLKNIGAFADVKKVDDTVKVRAGRGKQRNRRHKTRRGPLVIYKGANVPMIKALRNIPGVEVVHVSRLNLLQLAPGGHVGRFIIWTESAFKELNSVFGTHKRASEQKKNYHLPVHEVSNPDLSKIINSNAIQSAIKPAKHTARTAGQNVNPYNNDKFMNHLNPANAILKAAARKANEEGHNRRAKALAEKRGLSPAEKKTVRANKSNSRKWIKNMSALLQETHQKSLAHHSEMKQLLTQS